MVLDRDGWFFKAAKIIRLAQVAALAGADWIIPVDADELWFAVGMTLSEHLAGTDANQVQAEMFKRRPDRDERVSWGSGCVPHGLESLRL